jgi:UDP-sugar transporter A1/2/3
MNEPKSSKISTTSLLKWGSFLVLIFHTTGNTLVTRYSRIVASELYIPSTAVLMAEICKFLISILGYYYEYYSSTGQLIPFDSLYDSVLGPQSEWSMMAVPAILYFIQNIFQYVAFTYLDPATFQIISQLKLFTTAFFSVLWLGKKINSQKWASLALIVVGIIIVQLQNVSSSKATDAQGILFGSMIKVAACVLSGIAGVWFEGAIKKKDTSLFLKNIQLSFFSILPGFFIAVCIIDGEQVREKGFFYGYTTSTWVSIVFQSFGGLLVAVVVKYSDTILKVIATTLAIIVSSVFSVFIFDFQIRTWFVVGASIVMVGTYFYVTGDIKEQMKSFYASYHQSRQVIWALLVVLFVFLSLNSLATATSFA